MRRVPGTLAVLSVLFNAAPAQAYLGPGLGLGAIGSLIGILGSLSLVAVGSIWYPVKGAIRTWRDRRRKD